jgi:hypothetical protein
LLCDRWVVVVVTGAAPPNEGAVNLVDAVVLMRR